MHSVSNSSERLVNSIDFSNERILITGADGWFGRTAVGTDTSSVDLMTCPTVWLPVGCEFQAGMEGLS